MRKPKIVFDVNFFIFRHKCSKDTHNPICSYVKEWEDAVEKEEIEAIVPLGVEEVLMKQNLKQGFRDILAGLRGFPHKKEYLEPVSKWKRQVSSDEVQSCIVGSSDKVDKELVEYCISNIDYEDMVIYAQASRVGADYIVTGDRAWIGCEELFKTVCSCLSIQEQENEEIACGANMPKILPINSHPKEITK